MNKSLSERIADHESKKMVGTKNKVIFLALRQDIAEALEKGWPLIAIWETLHAEGKITFTYNTFRLYVSKFLGSYMPVSNKRISPKNDIILQKINQRRKLHPYPHLRLIPNQILMSYYSYDIYGKSKEEGNRFES